MLKDSVRNNDMELFLVIKDKQITHASHMHAQACTNTNARTHTHTQRGGAGRLPTPTTNQTNSQTLSQCRLCKRVFYEIRKINKNITQKQINNNRIT